MVKGVCFLEQKMVQAWMLWDRKEKEEEKRKRNSSCERGIVTHYKVTITKAVGARSSPSSVANQYGRSDQVRRLQITRCVHPETCRSNGGSVQARQMLSSRSSPQPQGLGPGNPAPVDSIPEGPAASPTAQLRQVPSRDPGRFQPCSHKSPTGYRDAPSRPGGL